MTVSELTEISEFIDNIGSWVPDSLSLRIEVSNESGDEVGVVRKIYVSKDGNYQYVFFPNESHHEPQVMSVGSD